MRWLFASLTVAMAFALCLAKTSEGSKSSPVNLTFAAEGLHCEGCVDSLTKALKSVKGVQKAEVSLKGKCAFVTLDESKTPVSTLVAQTHKQVSYRLTLLLPISNWDKADREKAVQVLKRVKGVANVKADKSGLLVSFDPKATVRYSELVGTLTKNGFKVLNSPVNSNGLTQNGSNQGSCCSECESGHSGSHSGSQKSECR